MDNLLVLAAGVGNPGASTFWASPIGGWIKGILAAVGVVIVIAALFKSAKDGLAGKFGGVAKTLLGAAVIAAICFRPELIETLITLVGNLLDKVLQSGQSFDK